MARAFCEIAGETSISRNAVPRYLRDEKAVRYKPRPPRLAKLDPFKDFVIERRRAAAERIPAGVLLMELRERGYCGGYTMVKRFVASLNRQHRLSGPIRSISPSASVGGRKSTRTMKHGLP